MSDLQSVKTEDLRSGDLALTYDPDGSPDPAVVEAHVRLVAPSLFGRLTQIRDLLQATVEDLQSKIEVLSQAAGFATDEGELLTLTYLLSDARAALGVAEAALLGFAVWLDTIETDLGLSGLVPVGGAPAGGDPTELREVAGGLLEVRALRGAEREARLLHLGASALARSRGRATGRLDEGHLLVARYVDYTESLLTRGLALTFAAA